MADVQPEAPHGALGERKARTQTSSTKQKVRKEIAVPQVKKAPKPPKNS